MRPNRNTHNVVHKMCVFARAQTSVHCAHHDYSRARGVGFTREREKKRILVLSGRQSVQTIIFLLFRCFIGVKICCCLCSISCSSVVSNASAVWLVAAAISLTKYALYESDVLLPFFCGKNFCVSKSQCGWTWTKQQLECVCACDCMFVDEKQ